MDLSVAANCCNDPKTGIRVEEKEHAYYEGEVKLSGYLSSTVMLGKLTYFNESKFAQLKAQNLHRKDWNFMTKEIQDKHTKDVIDEWHKIRDMGTLKHKIIESYYMKNMKYDAPKPNTDTYIALKRAVEFINHLSNVAIIETCEAAFKYNNGKHKCTGSADVILKIKNTNPPTYGIVDWKNTKKFRKDDSETWCWVNYKGQNPQFIHKTRSQLGFRWNKYLKYSLQVMLYYIFSKGYYNVDKNHLYVVNLSDDEQYDKDKYSISNFKIDPNKKILVHENIVKKNGKERWKLEYKTLEEFCFFLITNADSITPGCLPEFKKPNKKTKPIHHVITHQIKNGSSTKRDSFQIENKTKKAKTAD